MAVVLLIDDDEITLKAVEQALLSLGHRVVSTSDGLEAMRHMENEAFDLVVTDLRMIPVDGLQLIAHARKYLPATDVIVVTSYMDDRALARAMEMGCACWIAKPSHLARIMEPIQEVLKSRDAGTSPAQQRSSRSQADEEWVE
jgi:DNA-binding NtrC family response regulator